MRGWLDRILGRGPGQAPPEEIEEEWQDEVGPDDAAEAEPAPAVAEAEGEFSLDEALSEPSGPGGDSRLDRVTELEESLLPEALEELRSLMADSSERLRLAAARALGRRGDTDWLLEAVESEEWHVRQAALVGLDYTGDSRAYEAQVEALSDRHQRVVVAALHLVARTGDAQAAGHVMEIARSHRSRRVRLQAEWSLAAHGAAYRPFLIRILDGSDDRNRRIAARALRASLAREPDSEAVPSFMRALRAADPRLRRYAVECLGLARDARALPDLLRILETGEAGLRTPAAFALGRIGDTRCVDTLIKLLMRGEAHVRGAAARALGRLQDRRAVMPLLSLLRDPNKEVRAAAAEAVAELEDPRGVRALTQALRDRSREVRRWAAIGLARRRRPEALNPLYTRLAAEGDDRVREAIEEAIRTLEEVADSAVHAAMAGSPEEGEGPENGEPQAPQEAPEEAGSTGDFPPEAPGEEPAREPSRG